MSPAAAARALLLVVAVVGGLGAPGAAAAAGDAAGRGRKIEGRVALAARGDPRARVGRGGVTDPAVPLLVRAADPAGVAASLRASGGRVGAVAGDVLTARVPPAVVATLAADPRVLRVELARPLSPRLDRVRAVLEVDAIHAGEAPQAGAYTGRSVLIGAVDLTLDLGHRAFLAGDRSRVVALWDQDGTGQPPSGFDYGALCSAAQIDAGRCPHVAYHDHGTTVLAIAGGSRYAGTPYYGVAPGADLAFVNLGGLTATDDFDGWFTSALCDGVAYLFSLADERGQPAVANLSVGTHAGPHDGSSLGDRCLDNLVGPGRIVVAAAGNEGSARPHAVTEELVWVHASGTAGATPERVGLRFGEQLALGEAAQIWFEEPAASASARVGVRTDAGEEVTSAVVTLDDAVTELELAVAGVALGPAFLVTDQAPSGDRVFELVVVDGDEDGAEGALVWFVEVADTGPFDAYLDVSSGGGLVEHHSAGVTLDGRRSVGFPATAAGVIAVGSSVSRVSWRATDGVKREAYDVVTEDPLELGQLSSFSSRGPTRDPERTGTKPDCVAPGEMVVSALPAALLADTPPEVVVAERPAYYAIGAGTSQASPAAAGVIALLLERDPSLDPDAVRGLLRATSRLPEGVAPDGPDWGVGLLDARAALLSTPEIHPGEAPSAAPVDDGCGCAVAGRSGAVGAPWLLALLAGLGARCGRRAGRVRRGPPPG